MDLAAPANGLKLMLAIAIVFGLVAVYGQLQHFHHTNAETVTIVPAPNVSRAPLPNNS
jgi:heme/copper-type cytochrome/quinol oxidase subunit 3